MPTSYLSWRTPLVDLAKKAGEAIMEIYLQDDTDFGVQQKTDNSPLTKADLAAHNIILEGLRALSPDIPVISEESLATDYENRKHWERCWMVDPLDGTKEFIHKRDAFTVNIALIEQGHPSMGIVFAPAMNIMCWGSKIDGAFIQEDNIWSSIQVNHFHIDQVGLKVVASLSHASSETEAYLRKLKSPQLLNIGSSLKLLMVARGTADLYPRLAPTMEWDTAAADAIVRAAGGQVVEVDKGHPLVYNKPNLLNPYFIATGYLLEEPL